MLPPAIDDIVEFGPFRLHVSGRLLQADGVSVNVGSRALDLLIALVEQAGEVLSQRELIARAWPGLVVDEANVRVNIASLRKSLGDGRNGARYIVNVPGRGYSFVAPVTRTQLGSSSQEGEETWTFDPQSPSQPPAFVGERSLPEALTRLIGRDSSVSTVVELLTKHRFVSVIGPGGMGKTAVAISVAHALRDVFDGAVYYVDLSSVHDASLVPSAIASALGLRVQANDPKAGILAFLAPRRSLLVLDNCEHLIDQTAALSEWLYRSTAQTHLLATSRELLRAEGEHVHILPPLDVPPIGWGTTAADWTAFPAVQLFMDRAAASGSHEAVTDEVALLAADICRNMDGIPLAIELAAGRVPFHGVRGTAELIESRFNLLWPGRRSAPPRHQTLYAMLDWSYNLLSQTERRVLYRLSVFAGPFQLEGAQTIAAGAGLTSADATSAIASLIDKSLLSTSTIRGASYLRLLDTTRAYASEKLAESGEIHCVSHRLAGYLIEQLSRLESQNRSRPLEPALLQVGDVRTALAWAFSESGKGELATCLAALAAPHLLDLSLLDECHRWCQAALQKVGPYEGTKTHLILESSLAMSALFTRVDRGDLNATIERGLSLARKLKDHKRELELHAAQHIVMTHLGRYREAVEVGSHSAELARQVGYPEGIVMSEWMLGCAHHFAGDHASAIRHTEEGFKQAERLGTTKIDVLGFAHRTRALNVLARALWLSGAPDRAAQVARQALEESELDEQPMSMLVALTYATTVFLWRGDIAESEALVDRLIGHGIRYSYGTNAAFGIALSGEIALLRGEFRTAANKLREALDTLKVERRQNLATMLSRSLCEALLACGDIPEAQLIIDAAMERAEALHQSFEMPELLRTRAKIEIAAGRLDPCAAEAMLRRSIELAYEQGALSLVLRSTMTLGGLLATEGRTDEAHAMLAEVYSGFSEGYDTHDLRTARQLIKTWRPRASQLSGYVHVT
ncbi:winged helix-turn-helix domain-containing protein [Devosia sp. 1635]|uniref:ATP-binding protein n=1 Tax=Devosia sp. 1635 TaxID=2726066 RepID=UPI001564AE85|nr:winged helix-turn-helix domain-containing protein [Devosia sp. 1635]